MSCVAVQPPRRRSVAQSRLLHVLTLTPFYPAAQDPSRGSFVAEPLRCSEELDIRNHVIAVQTAYRRGNEAMSPEFAAEWLTYPSLPGNVGLPSAGFLLAARLKARIRELLAAGALDLIHAHAALPCGHAAALLGKEFGIPFIVSVHGLDVYFERQAAPVAWWCRRISQNVYRSAKKVVCISNAVRNLLPPAPHANATVVYNGVDPDLFWPGDEAPSPTILAVGNLIPTKGHAQLFQAFSQVVREFPHSRLEIIGDGPERKDLERLASSLRIRDRISFLGRRSRTQVAAAMRRCAVFALPSVYEGLGCVYLEAMASARPVIGCKGQGISELVRHGSNGFLVPPGGTPELHDCLRTLLGSPELRRSVGAEARNTVLDGFTVASQAQQLAAIYRECAR
jgi:teichuronic acid biosynthesis glycosyltransferase TuaC